MADLTRKRDRERLKVRRAPHWHRLAEGCYLGFRRGADTWHARFRDRDGAQRFQALGAAIEYDDAKRAAEAWFAQMGSTAVRSARRGTVKDSLEHYLKHLRDQGRDAAAKVSEQRFKAIVWTDPLGAIALEALTRDDFREWRDRLREGRQARSINRHVRSVVAGLNRAHQDGHVGDPAAWKLDALADDVDDSGETAVLLTPKQRATLIKAATPEVAAFLRGLELTGARPGELAAATVADLDAAHGVLTLSHRKGRPARLRYRAVVLGDAGIDHFKKQARSKLPTALLFTTDTGRPLERHDWADAIRAAVAKVNEKARGANRLPNDASAYSFRHARISELLQVHGVDPLTVAAQTGTSLRMIERSYFKFIASAMRDKLRAAS